MQEQKSGVPQQHLLQPNLGYQLQLACSSEQGPMQVLPRASTRAANRKLQQLLSHSGRVCHLLVMAQVLRLLLVLCADPATATTSHHLRSQLTREVKAAAAAARLDGAHSLTALALLKHLPQARLQQLRAAAAARKASLKATAMVSKARQAPLNSGSSASTDDAGAQALQRPYMAPPAFWAQPQVPLFLQHQAQLPLQLRPQQPSMMDVGCLLETTLVAAAAEAQLQSLSFGDPSQDSLMDDASSPVDIEGVMQEELKLAQQSGLV